MNVRVVLPGRPEEFPVDCTYEGLDDEGMAVWEGTATLPVDPSRASYMVLADSLPPRSSLRFNFSAEGGTRP